MSGVRSFNKGHLSRCLPHEIHALNGQMHGPRRVLAHVLVRFHCGTISTLNGQWCRSFHVQAQPFSLHTPASTAAPCNGGGISGHISGAALKSLNFSHCDPCQGLPRMHKFRHHGSARAKLGEDGASTRHGSCFGDLEFDVAANGRRGSNMGAAASTLALASTICDVHWACASCKGRLGRNERLHSSRLAGSPKAQMLTSMSHHICQSCCSLYRRSVVWLCVFVHIISPPQAVAHFFVCHRKALSSHTNVNEVPFDSQGTRQVCRSAVACKLVLYPCTIIHSVQPY